MRGFTSSVIAVGAISLMMVGSAATAGTSIVYDNIASPLPGNVPSVGFEATGASEFGGQVQFDGTARKKPKLTVVMSSWGCQSGYWYSGDCGTSPGAKFNAPITFKVYTVGAGDEPGTLIGSVTHTISMPYRPSANYTKCTGADAGKWYQPSTATCFNGKAFTVTVGLGSLDLPDTAIIGVAYNTTHYGYSPIGEDATCYSSSGGCPYDALNVGTGDAASVGVQPLPDDAYFDSASGGEYCDGGAGGTGTFRLDAGCWTGYQPAFLVKAK